jgi:hypothetical protein
MSKARWQRFIIGTPQTGLGAHKVRRRAERQTFDLFLSHEMRMAGTGPAMHCLLNPIARLCRAKSRYFGRSAMFGKKK